VTIEERLAKLEAADGEFREAAEYLRNALTVTAAIQERLADVQESQAEVQTRQAEIQKSQAEIQKTQAESIANLFQAVDELTDKLNGRIDYLDNLHRNPPPQN
jgi:peptidoglycan hydrolase CwlO-like protein